MNARRMNGVEEYEEPIQIDYEYFSQEEEHREFEVGREDMERRAGRLEAEKEARIEAANALEDMQVEARKEVRDGRKWKEPAKEESEFWF